MSRPPRLPRVAIRHTLFDGRRAFTRRLSANDLRAAIRSGRHQTGEAQVYETTDRTGLGLHVAYVHFGPGRWNGVTSVIEIFEIPTRALLDL